MYKGLKCMCRAVILLVRSSVLLCSCCLCGRVFPTVPIANTLIPPNNKKNISLFTIRNQIKLFSNGERRTDSCGVSYGWSVNCRIN